MRIANAQAGTPVIGSTGEGQGTNRFEITGTKDKLVPGRQADDDEAV